MRPDVSNPGPIERHIVDTILGTRELGPNSVLIVHSAFASLSRQGLRAERFCQALLDALNGGTLLMPTMTWRTVTPDNPVFDEMATPSHTGILTEVFRTAFATHRSLHATHSVAGCGPLAAKLLSTHHEGSTPCAANSPYGLIRDHDAHILLIGVGLESCTAIHHAEEMMAEDIYVQPTKEGVEYQLRSRHGSVHRVLTRRHPRLPRDFPSFGPELAQRGHLITGKALGVAWQLISARGLYQTLFEALAANRAATLVATV